MKIQESIVQEAIERTGFGRFNVKVSILAAFIYTNVAICLLSIGYVLPAAVCDFKMTTIDKGRMAIAHTLGTCIGCLVWGFVADLKGRRIALLSALLLQSNVEIMVSFTSNYWAFLFLKVLSGFAVIGQVGPLYPYVGEFQPEKYRKKVMASLGFIMVTGFIVLPLLAWAIIPLEFEIRNEYFFFRSWNLYVLLCALIAEILGIWFIFFPESPKYLAETGQIQELMKVLTEMYQTNTGGSAEDYITILNKNSGNDLLVELVNLFCTNKSISGDKEPSRNKEFRKMLNDFKLQGKNALKAPHIKNLVLVCVCMFCAASVNNSLLTWFPEIFQRLANFEILHPNEPINICSISASSSNATKDENEFLDCNQAVDTSVYRTSLWLGLSTIIPNLLYLLLADKLGLRFCAVTYFATGLGSMIGFLFANSYTQYVILSCFFHAVMPTSLSVLYSFNVVLFPTNIRVFASTAAVLSNRIGTIFGNTLLAYLIDNYCTILIASVSLQLIMAIVLSFSLRK